ncbi:uncharacterized protein VTP21DRAFT_9859 [Calcarisporiella thermophila]|uniref:uncharacterized protein n=1 Tax=Calcarisporiella thermophila TaxID=911321 RepID=UPI0037431141
MKVDATSRYFRVRVKDVDDKWFLHLYWLSDHDDMQRRVFELEVTDTKRFWTGRTSLQELERKKPKSIKAENYTQILVDALSDKTSENGKSFVQVEINESNIKLTWHLFVEEVDFILASLVLNPVLNGDTPRFWNKWLIDFMGKLSTNEKEKAELEMQMEHLSSELCALQENQERMILEKQEWEAEIFEKFVLLINAKKKKIRELKEALDMTKHGESEEQEPSSEAAPSLKKGKAKLTFSRKYLPKHGHAQAKAATLQRTYSQPSLAHRGESSTFKPLSSLSRRVEEAVHRPLKRPKVVLEELSDEESTDDAEVLVTPKVTETRPGIQKESAGRAKERSPSNTDIIEGETMEIDTEAEEVTSDERSPQKAGQKEEEAQSTDPPSISKHKRTPANPLSDYELELVSEEETDLEEPAAAMKVTKPRQLKMTSDKNRREGGLADIDERKVPRTSSPMEGDFVPQLITDLDLAEGSKATEKGTSSRATKNKSDPGGSLF